MAGGCDPGDVSCSLRPREVAFTPGLWSTVHPMEMGSPPPPVARGRSLPDGPSRTDDESSFGGSDEAARSPSWSRSDLLGLGILLLVVAWFWIVRVAGPRPSAPGFFEADLYALFVPLYASMQRALRAGSLPFWNTYLGCGSPQLAMLLTASLYPSRLLLLFFLSPTESLEVSTIGHVLLAAVGTFALARALRFGPCGSLAAAMGFTWGAAFGEIVAPATMLEPGAWLPWLGLGIVRLSRRGLWRDVALVAIALAAPILAGGYQVAVYVAYGGALVWLGLLADPSERAHAIDRRSVARLALAGLLAVALASPQWLPTLLWSTGTMRSTEGLSDAQIDPLESSARWSLEHLLGRRASLPGEFLPPPLVALAVLGVLSRRRTILPLAAGGCVALLLSLGRATPFFGLYRWLPGFAMFRLPVRLWILVVFAASLAAAAGVGLIEARARYRGRMLSILGTLVFCMGLVFSFRALQAAGANPSEATASKALRSPLGLSDLLPVGGEVLSLALPPSIAGPASLVPLALSAIGLRRNDSWLPWAGREAPLEVYHPPLRRLAAKAGLFRIALVGTALDPGWTETQAALVPFSSVGQIDPLSSRRLVDYEALATRGALPSPDQAILPLGGLDLGGPLANPRLLDMASVRYLAAPRDPMFRLSPGLASLLDSWPAGPDLGRGDEPGLEVRSNPQALPRAYLVTGVRPVAGEAAAASAIVAPGFDPRREVVVEGGLVRREPEADLVPAEIERYEPEHVVVRTDGPADSVLVLTDTFAPGWRATVDGREVPVRPANLLFRAVEVPAGRHVVTFTYATPGFRAGMIAAMLAVAILLAGPLVGSLPPGRPVAQTQATRACP